jgi:tetratricopeptide (TPR) repeat protein
MKKLLITISLLLSFNCFSSDILEDLNNFHRWLAKHELELAKCETSIAGDTISLCDKTEVSVKELKSLFAMNESQLVNFIKGKGINLEVFCSSPGRFTPYCKKDIKRKMFKAHYHLQGQFIGIENTILLKSDALKGSLIHEYVHYLQFTNSNKIWGKRYKAERIALEQRVVARMDAIIEKVRKDEKKLKKQGKLSAILKEMLALSKGLQRFSKWQDLIDERNIFLLYIKWGNLFGVSVNDVQLARKNMGFICKRTDIRGLSKAQCPKLASKKISPLSEVKRIIKEIRPNPSYTLIEKFLKGIEKVESEPLSKTISRVSDYIYKKWSMSADLSYESIKQKDNILPDTTLEQRRAHCVGLSTLYLLAFEKIGVDASLIRVPRHVLVEACDGEECLLIETLKKGKVVTKRFYFKNNYLTKEELKDTFYFKPAKIASSLYLSLGFIANEAKQYSLAEYLYKKSLEADRRFAEGYSNLAAVYQAMGKKRMARSYIDIALKINPSHTSSYINKALIIWNEHGKNKRAEVFRLLDQAQKLNPLYHETFRVRSLIYEKLKNYQKAFINQLVVSLQQQKNCISTARLFKLKSMVKSVTFLKKYKKDLKILKANCEI